MHRPFWLFALCSACICFGAPNNLPIADFENESFGEWTVEGTAFGSGPTAGAVSGQKGIKSFGGRRLANSGAAEDAATGCLQSPEFKLERAYIRFLIGGAELPDQTSFNLLVDGKTVRSATGLKSKIGRSQILRHDDWSVAEFQGKIARLEIVDRSTNSAAHILIDDIVQTDAPLKSPAFDLTIKKRYLLLPVKNKSRQVPLQMILDGKMVREFEIELASGLTPDWWAFSDMRDYLGKTLTIRTSDKLPAEFADPFSTLLRQSDVPIEANDVYREANRPQFHFTVRRGFNNDPNGLVFFNGEYHMFYQNNPYGIDWNNMHWGHAVSRDLLRWTELPPALYPHGIAGGAYSGGALVDYGNTLGFGKGKEDVLIASYTGIGRGECIAYGTGRALSLIDIPQNPVLKHSGWDPNVMRYEPENKWLMLVFERKLPSFGYAFYESTNLTNWHKLDLIEGFQDCPDFFELPVEGETSRKWVLYGSKKEATNRYASKSSYMIGSFNGSKFTPETEIIEGHLGPQFYAGQSFKEMPGQRRVMLGWLNGANYPGMPFSQGMTVPLELKLRRTDHGIRMTFSPARELEKLRSRKSQSGKDLSIAAANELLKKVNPELLDCELAATTDPSQPFTLSVHGMDIRYDAETGELSCKDTKAVVRPVGGVLRLRLLIDRGVLELFANDGEVAMAFAGNIFSKDKGLTIRGGADVKVTALRATEMNSIWIK
ncbi:MAG TPA: GH32 C-terminal domain-containing protein [Verrucomicrobiae bacterium]|nr:GH32 C-terminal domain-containing protein [Verrucomicrobiae bacterium]